VPPLRWAIALCAIPVGAVMAAWLLLGASPDDVLGDGGLRLVAVFFVEVLIALVTVQLFEELAWTGLVQHRLQRRHGAMRASLLVAPAFAMIHLPTYFIGAPVTGEKAVAVLMQMTVVIVFAAFFRVLVTWTYNVTASSVLMASTLHASFNTASGSTFVGHLAPEGASGSMASFLPLLSVVALACVVTLGSRGGLGFPRDGATQRVPGGGTAPMSVQTSVAE
jgi:membrane protease YdiL (CAAX protease family)